MLFMFTHKKGFVKYFENVIQNDFFNIFNNFNDIRLLVSYKLSILAKTSDNEMQLLKKVLMFLVKFVSSVTRFVYIS